MIKASLICCAIILLSGCTSVIQKTPPPVTAEIVYIEGEFNQESLYDLMLAEIAGQRREFKVAFERYLKQAQKTQDSAVAERATRIAQYLRNADAILQSARIWRQVAPNNPEPYQLEANILLHQGEYASALPLITQALSFDPLRTLALIRTQLPKLTPDLAKAYIKLLGTEKEHYAKRADLELTLALLHSFNNEVKAALTHFDRAQQLEPDNPEILIHKAELLRNQGDYTQALTLVQSAFEQQPSNRQLNILYTQLLFQAEQTSKAIKQVAELRRRYSKDHQLNYYLALLLLDYKQYNDAKEVLSSLFELKPEDSSPHFYLGHIAAQQQQNEQAIEHFIQVRDGNNILKALSKATDLLSSASHQNRIEQILNDARASLPTLAPQLFSLEAEWLHLHEMVDQALVVLDDAILDYPNNTTLLYTRAMMVESNNFPQAEKDLKHILSYEPDNVLVKNALGYTLTLHSERYDEAYKLIRSALDSSPDDPAIIDSMGWVLFKMSKYPEAIRYLERAYHLISDPEVAAHLIQAYWFNGQKDKALKLLKSSQEQSPDDPYLLEAAEIIKEQ